MEKFYQPGPVHPPLKILDARPGDVRITPAGMRAATFEGLLWPYGRLWAKILPDGGFAYLICNERK